MTAVTRILGTPPSVGAVANGPAPDGGLPDSIEGYSIVKPIGQGGMGCVFEVCHNALGKRFALKLLSDSLRNNSEAVDRFRSETLALGKLEHPNIVSAIDAGVWQGRPFLVTELLKGQDLTQRVAERGSLDTETVIKVAAQLSSALSFAHQQGYFHRDIKPSNIFYQPDGTAKLLDFGLVRSESNQSLTRTGCFMGTVDFVAPEQAGNAAQAGIASDIYSFGCTLIYLLGGKVPFPDSRYPTLAAKIAAHLQDTPDWFSQGAEDQPAWLVELIRAMVAKDPKKRPTSCQAVNDCLTARSFPTTQPAKATNKSTQRLAAIAASAVIAVAATIAVCWSQLSDQQLTEHLQTAAPSTSREGSIEPEPSRPAKLPDQPVQTQNFVEKTLPVSTTHNARGAKLSTKQIISNSPSEKSNKEPGDEQ